MLEKFKEFIGINEDYEDDDEDYAEDDNTQTSSTEILTSSDDAKDSFTKSYSSSFSSSFDSDDKNKENGGNIVSMADTKLGGYNNLRISIQEPVDYDNDAPKIVDDILNKKVVVLNLEMVEMDKKRKIIDFVSGAVYALNGKINKVTKGIFVVTPKGVSVDNKVASEISSGNFNTL